MSVDDKNIDYERVKEVYKFEIMDTEPEASFDDITLIASTVGKVPISMVSIIDENRQWFKSSIGINEKEFPRNVSFCDHIIRNKLPLIVEDATKDPRFRDNPKVKGPPHICFYAGFPLISNGHVIGTLCIIDSKSKTLDPKNCQMLEALARQVMNQLELKLLLKNENKMKTEILEKNLRFSNLVDNLNEVVFQTDENGNWTYLSLSWEKIFGFKVQECLGLPYLNFVSPDDRPKNLEKFLTFGDEKQKPSRRFVRFLDKGSNPIWIEIFERQVYSLTGKFVGTAGTLTDATLQIKQNKIIEEQKNKMIQSARLYSLGEMAAGISHEINNPLAIIRGSIQMLGRSLSKDILDKVMVQDAVTKIDSTVVRISKIISGLKSFARDGENDPFVSYSVDTIIADSLEFCQTRFENQGVQVDLPQTGADILIECRPVQLSQVLLNLLNNAFDAVETAKIKKIRIQKIVNESSVVIKVLDSGPGVPKQIRERIMDPFFTTKGPFKGMGLGLSLSKGIIESHKGTLELSEDSGETCFIITLPVKQSR